MKYVIILIFFVSVGIYAQDNSAEKKEAPNFELQTIEDDEVTLSDYLGEGPVILSFWATWCKPCVEEMKYYNKIYERYEEKGLKILAISEDNERSVAKVIPFVRANNYKFDILLDPDNSVARKYYVSVVPHTYIINSNGKIIYSHSGYKKGDEKKVEKIILELLGEVK